jgi:nucleotide-binding universal stress UspA family protein
MKVLVATDGSDRSMKAVKRALELAEKEGAEITLLSVAPQVSSLFFEMDRLPVSVQDACDNEAKSWLDRAKAVFRARGITVSSLLAHSAVAANAILDVAAEGKFDWIIMGSTGKTGIERYLIGSTASKVLAHAHCSVAIAR